MNTLTEQNLKTGLIHKLTEWYGTTKWKPLMVWHQDGTNFCVIKCGDHTDYVRVFPLGNNLEISVDKRVETS